MTPLSSQLQQHWQTLVERAPEDFPLEALGSEAQAVFTFSDFVQQSLTAHPEWLASLESDPPQADEWRQYAGWLQAELAEVYDETALMRALRLFRRRVMVRIAWAQALSQVSEEDTLQQLSHLAETLIVNARNWL